LVIVGLIKIDGDPSQLEPASSGPPVRVSLAGGPSFGGRACTPVQPKKGRDELELLKTIRDGD
jgi:hypothetical protein